MVKPIAFRPTPIIQEFLDEQLKKNADAKLSQIVIKALEDAITLIGTNDGVVTGIIIPCPLRRNVENGFEAQVDTSVCKTCHKHPCSTWEDMKSWKRTSPLTSVGL